MEVGHGTLIQIGKTKLLCHLHPGRETCLECEPGVVREEAGDSRGGGNREGRHKENVQSLKRKYGLDNPAEDLLKPHDPNYHDRAREHGCIVFKMSQEVNKKNKINQITFHLVRSTKSDCC